MVMCVTHKMLMYDNIEIQAWAELCQAQYKLEMAKFWIGSVASLKLDCLIQTERIGYVNLV